MLWLHFMLPLLAKRQHSVGYECMGLSPWRVCKSLEADHLQCYSHLIALPAPFAHEKVDTCQPATVPNALNCPSS